MKTCPRCNHENYEIVHRSECGFNFKTGTMGRPSGFSPDLSVNIRAHKAPALAFLIAPMAGPLGIFIGYCLVDAILRTEPYQSENLWTIGLLPFFYCFAAPVVYLFSLLFGLPMYLLLKWRKWLNRTNLVTGWAVVGMLSNLTISSNHIQRTGEISFPHLIPYAIGGGFVGLIFWKILSQDKHMEAP